jgi:hypothetical protein
MPREPLDYVPLWLLLLSLAALLWLILEFGYRFGKWRHAHLPDEREQPVGAMVASILGLAALVIGFTFSFAASRFDDRRLTVLEEANAIGTCYLRARILPEPERNEVARLLMEYVNLRIQAVMDQQTNHAISRSEAIHELLWQQAASAANKNQASIMTGIFIQSLNNVIDVHAKRILVGLHSRIPIVIWAGLFGLSMLGMAAVGYQAALTTTRRSPAMIALVITFTVVLIMIVDLDRSQEGLLRVSQQSMLDLQRSMQPSATSGSGEIVPRDVP